MNSIFEANLDLLLIIIQSKVLNYFTFSAIKSEQRLATSSKKLSISNMAAFREMSKENPDDISTDISNELDPISVKSDRMSTIDLEDERVI
jgi:hypothetical protein